jgi:hypothetical protein
MHATARTPLKPAPTRLATRRTGTVSPVAHLIWTLRQRAPQGKAGVVTFDLTGERDCRKKGPSAHKTLPNRALRHKPSAAGRWWRGLGCRATGLGRVGREKKAACARRERGIDTRARGERHNPTLPRPSPHEKQPHTNNTGPIARRRFASVGARIDVGEDVALADVPGHLVCAFETTAPSSPNKVNPLDSDASSALVLTTLEVEDVTVTVDGVAVPLQTATLLKPGAVLGFGEGCEYVVERNAFAHA